MERLKGAALQGELWWGPGPRKPVLEGSAVQVWCASLEQDEARVAAFFQTLSVDEKARAQRFYFARDQRHFVVGRGVLRDILSRYLDLPPQELLFAYGPQDKPSLAPALAERSAKALALRFNLSHSGDLALYAFTYGREVGIDIERLRPLEDAERIARRFFSTREVQVFCALPTHVRLEGFFNCWCRKESYIKATGDGLSMPLDRFTVSLTPGEPARFLHVDGDPAEAARWSLRELHPAPGYAAAVCVAGEGWELAQWSWRPRQ
jgi:4'-phosphopantetheinyl transferase